MTTSVLYTHACTFTLTQIHTNVLYIYHTCIQVDTCTHIYIHTNTNTYTHHMYTHMYEHICTYTHTHTHTHTDTTCSYKKCLQELSFPPNHISLVFNNGIVNLPIHSRNWASRKPAEEAPLRLPGGTGDLLEAGLHPSMLQVPSIR